MVKVRRLRRHHRSTLAGLFATLGVLWGQTASAQVEPETVALRYNAPPECAQEASFVQLVQTKTTMFRLGSAEQARRRFDVSVQNVAPSMGRLTITEWDGHLGERTVEGERCEEVIEALALAVVLAVDPKAAGLGRGGLDVAVSAPTPSASTAVPTFAPPLVSVTPPIIEPKRSEPLGFGVGLHAVGAAWATPNPLLGAAAMVEVREGRGPSSRAIRIGLEQGWSAHTHADSSAVEFSRTLGRVEVCLLSWIAGPAAVLPCGQASMGMVSATSDGVPRAKHVFRPWAAVGPDLLVRLEVGRGATLDLRMGLDVALLRDRFVFQPDVLIFQVPWASGFVAIGGSYQIP